MFYEGILDISIQFIIGSMLLMLSHHIMQWLSKGVFEIAVRLHCGTVGSPVSSHLNDPVFEHSAVSVCFAFLFSVCGPCQSPENYCLGLVVKTKIVPVYVCNWVFVWACVCVCVRFFLWLFPSILCILSYLYRAKVLAKIRWIADSCLAMVIHGTAQTQCSCASSKRKGPCVVAGGIRRRLRDRDLLRKRKAEAEEKAIYQWVYG